MWKTLIWFSIRLLDLKHSSSISLKPGGVSQDNIPCMYVLFLGMTSFSRALSCLEALNIVKDMQRKRTSPVLPNDFHYFTFVWSLVNPVSRNSSWLRNQMISLILIFGCLCRSSCWRPWPHIGGCRLVWPLLRPQMTFLDHFFAKYVFSGYDVG